MNSVNREYEREALLEQPDKPFLSSVDWPLVVAIGALVIGLVGILSMSMVYGLSGGYPYDYGVVMDAGSSKTNTIVYKWKANKHKGTGCVLQSDSCYSEGGIANMDPMQLDPVIDCSKKVTSHIEESSRSKTPLYFAATAGMRLLNLTDPKRVDKILKQLSIHLNETGLSVRNIEIISGRDEGIYAWIAANFLQQTLEKPQKFDPWVATTYGALDLGGASTQVAYAIPESDDTNSDVLNLTLYGQTHHVFSHSNLCFGRDQANKRLWLLLLDDTSQKVVEDPCLPTGYIKKVKGKDLFAEPCMRSSKFPGAKDDKSLLEKTYSFTGSSNPEACRGNVTKLLDAKLCNSFDFKECFKKLENIPEDQKYLAFATYYFTTDFLNITKSTLEEYNKTVNSYCSKSYAEVQAVSTSKYATQYCFNGQYIHEILTKGFGINSKKWANIEFVGSIAEKDVGWTLGYMINATNLIPEKAATPHLVSATALTVSLVLFVLMILATLVFFMHFYRKNKDSVTLPKSHGDA